MITLSFIGCSSDDDSTPAPTPVATDHCQTDIAFLRSGKHCTYQISQFGTDSGSMELAFGDCSGSGYVTTQKFFNTAGDVTSNHTDVFYQDGDYLYNDVDSNGGYAAQLYKKNAALGDTWEEIDGDRTIYHEVTDIDSLITVPAGSFHCKVYKYSTSTTINDSYIFWNDEIGEIMEDAGFFTLKLTEHNY